MFPIAMFANAMFPRAMFAHEGADIEPAVTLLTRARDLVLDTEARPLVLQVRDR